MDRPPQDPEDAPSGQRPGEVSGPPPEPAPSGFPAGADEVRPRLVRSRSDRIISGVAGGLAHYLGVDPVLVRVAWVLLVLLGFGTGIVIYIVAWIVIPEESADAPARPAPRADAEGMRFLLGAVLVVAGLIWLVRRWLPVFFDRFFEFEVIAPLIVIGVGLAVLLQGLRR